VVAPEAAQDRLKPSAPAEVIQGAVERVLADGSYRQNAQKMAASLRAGEGCIDPIARLEQLAGAGPVAQA